MFIDYTLSQYWLTIKILEVAGLADPKAGSKKTVRPDITPI